jgi:hypothetical protein
MNKIEITSEARAKQLLERGVVLKIFSGKVFVEDLVSIEDFKFLQGPGGTVEPFKVFRDQIGNREDGHRFTKSWLFDSEEERDLANAFAAYSEMNGMSNNDVMQLFSALCRIGKGSGGWPG